MGNILVNSNGDAIIYGNKAFEVTSSVDSNIVSGNIKKDVTILGVTGTYEGSGGGGVAGTSFYDCSATPPGAKGAGGGSEPGPGPEPGTSITFYVPYPNNNNKVPDMFIFYDKNKIMTNTMINYGIITQSQPISDTYYGGTVAASISITSVTSTLLTLLYSIGWPNGSLDLTNFQFAPIYLS